MDWGCTNTITTGLQRILLGYFNWKEQRQRVNDVLKLFYNYYLLLLLVLYYERVNESYEIILFYETIEPLVVTFNHALHDNHQRREEYDDDVLTPTSLPLPSVRPSVRRVAATHYFALCIHECCDLYCVYASQTASKVTKATTVANPHCQLRRN